MYPKTKWKIINQNKNENKNLNITLHTSCLRVYHNCQPRQLAIQISLIPHFTTHFTTRYKIGQLTIQLTIQLTSKLDTITQISTRSTTHFTTHSNSTHPCTTHHLAIPWLRSHFVSKACYVMNTTLINMFNLCAWPCCNVNVNLHVTLVLYNNGDTQQC